MNFKTTQHGTVSVVHLQGNLMGGPDASTLNDKLHGLVSDGKKHVVIDLGGVEFMNSSGLGLLLGGASLLKNAGGKLVLAAASGKIGTLIKITKLDPVFEQYRSVPDAIAAFKKK
jgi:anti-sigma B factor antagonist